MGNLLIMLTKSTEDKPAFGSPCNHCGYCCLTEVCPIGQELTGVKIGPCKLIVTNGGKHYCKLVLSGVLLDEVGVDKGCCAKTQIEAISDVLRINNPA